jgi:uncharacterized repeat protein (TIGR03803 family)
MTPPAVAGGAWTETILYIFNGRSDGGAPRAGLISDESGALYGTTLVGPAPSGRGTVFKLTPSAIAGAWTEIVLYAFSGGSDGAVPAAALISDASGALYGSTVGGGAFGGGTVFKLIGPADAGGTWNETALYSFPFSGYGDGGPHAGVMADGSGALYGTTFRGGDNNIGTVFKLTPPAVAGGTWTETVLHSFSGSDGAYPEAVLISDASGALYGTTDYGGANNAGTVFKLTPPAVAGGTWTQTVLHSFSGSDGAYPSAGLISDASGALYGTTLSGGVFGWGTVFSLMTPVTFVGVPGQATCNGQTVSTLANRYGGMPAAAGALGYASVQALKNGIQSYCGGS